MRLLILLAVLFSACWQNNSESPVTYSPTETTDAIGTQYFQWIDSTRTDNYYGGQRLINVQVWYPADLSDTSQKQVVAPYYYEIEKAVPYLAGWSRSDLAHGLKIRTRSALNAPLLKTKIPYPLLLFSPSLGGNLSNYSYYAEQLAQAGYIVAGINHLYESEYVISPEEEVYPVNLRFHDSLKTLDIPSQITADDYRLTKGIRQEVLGKDMLFALDKILELNATTFNNTIDSARVGVWGHSIGGAASVFAAYLDNRIKAVVNLDGTPPSIALENGIKVPFLFIEDLTDYANHSGYAKLHARRNAFCQINTQYSYRILINGIHHNSFQDYNYHGAETPLEKERALQTLEQVSGYLNRFFDHHLSDDSNRVFQVQQSDSLEVLVFEPG